MNGPDLQANRRALGLTQKELGGLLNISAQQISNYENGRMPVPRTVELALEALLQRETSQTRGRLPLYKEEGDFIQCFVSRLKEALGDKLILALLFGSRARGQAGEESDTDIFILLKSKCRKERKTVFSILFSLDPCNQHRLSPVIYSLKEFQMNEKLRSPFIANLKREGIFL